jgi:Integrase core domain
MAEAFVRTIKRDYVRVSPRPNAEAVLRQLPSWIAHHNEVHPHKALGYRSPREFITAHEKPCYETTPGRGFDIRRRLHQRPAHTRRKTAMKRSLPLARVRIALKLTLTSRARLAMPASILSSKWMFDYIAFRGDLDSLWSPQTARAIASLVAR